MAIKISDETEHKIVELYNEGCGVMELSDEFQLHRTTIQRVLKRHNVKLRKRTPAHYDIHFFDEYNANSCYWAGFIAADGYVRFDRANVSIHLSVNDVSHLKKLEVLTNYIGKTRVYENECCLSFAGEWFPKALADNFDICPRKTFNITISDKIPKNMIPHFLRGYFDGDGSVVKTDDGYLRANFTSGSVVLLRQIVDYMYNVGIRVRNDGEKAKIYQSSRSTGYSCKNTLQVLDLLYSNSTDLTRLDRKYQLYLQYKINKEIQNETSLQM
jgi:hypothetical protein